MVEYLLQDLVLFSKIPLRLFALGNILYKRHHVTGRSFRTGDQRHRFANPQRLAVLTKTALFDLKFFSFDGAQCGDEIYSAPAIVFVGEVQ